MQSQEVLLPTDLRQHNLTEYNSSLLSPVFALDRNNPQSIALWARWQWQTIDGDPTSMFLNYSRRLNTESAGGIGFFQNNTGIFLNTGGVLNYAYALELKNNAQIAFGLNLFGYSRQLADDRFQPDPNIGLPILDENSEFILRLAPSLRFKIDDFSIGIVAENLMDYNFSTKEKDSGPMEKVYIGLASYNFPVTIFGNSEASYIQPTIYMKTLPNYDNQFGLTTLFSTPKFWVQAGYNSFYGISGGLGGRLFRRFSLGALMEFGTSTDLDGTDPSFELVSSYKLGPVERKQKLPDPLEEEEEELPLITEEETKEENVIDKKEERRLEKEARLAEKQQKRDSVVTARQQEKLAKTERRAQEKMQDSLADVQKRINLAEAERMAQQRRDSIATAKNNAKLAAQKAKDSLAQVKREAELANIRLEEEKRKDSIAALREQERLAAAAEQAQRTKDSIAEVNRLQQLAEASRIAEQRQKDSIATAQREQQRAAEAARLAQQKEQDSIAAVKKAAALAEARRLAEQKTRDSLATIRRQEREAAIQLAEQKRKDSIAAVEKAEALAAARRLAEEKTRDSLANVRRQEREAAIQLAEQKKQDSLEAVKAAEALAEARNAAQQKTRDSLAEIRRQEREAAVRRAEQQRVEDSIAALKQPETEVVENEAPAITPKDGEKYEEAVTEDGLEPGFYLIANVFGTKKYFDSFMATLKDQGLRPRSFFRSLNKYNYVYLQRYDSMTEARKARDTKFNGRYQGKTWIFRVVAK